MKENKELQAFYEAVYRKGEGTFFSRFSTGVDDSENDDVVVGALSWAGKTVVDVGCGTGHTAARIAASGAKLVVGLDYAPTAIATAEQQHKAPNLNFRVGVLDDLDIKPDVIVSCGTLEHFEDPKAELLKMLNRVGPKGEVLITCPYFINIRGFVWMTLSKLFNVPMSLTDLQFLSPFDFERWLMGTGHELTKVVCFDYDRANGTLMLKDLERRLTNALRDAGMANDRVPELMAWFADVVSFHQRNGEPGLGGRNALYRISPKTVEAR